jgi:hypothetical protein
VSAEARLEGRIIMIALAAIGVAALLIISRITF